MNIVLTLAFLFFIGSISGWVIELFFRRFTNPEKKWINPGFCTGPYLPIYGFGLIGLYLIVSAEQYILISNVTLRKIVLFVLIAICMTTIEYIAGILCLKFAKVRLWDYRNEVGNIQGVICPKFTVAWTFMGIVYYFTLHSLIQNAVNWLSNNLTFSFVIGMFYGFLLTDVAQSIQLVGKLKKYAEENGVIVKFETLKSNIREKYDESKKKYHFFLPFRSDQPLTEHLKEILGSFEKRKRK